MASDPTEIKQPTLIRNAEELTPEWLNTVLKQSEFDGEVTDLSGERIGTGQVGENVRFNLQGSGNLPETLVGKFVSSDPVSRQTGIQQQTYVKEVFFYQSLQEIVDINTPRIFFTDCDQETHDFVILMEDLAPGEQGNQLTGCSVDDAALALEQAAKLHGPSWGMSTLSDHALLSPGDPAEKTQQLKMIYTMVLPAFLERYSHRLPDEYIAVIEAMADKLDRYQEINKGPNSLVHLDFRLDNMMFGGPHKITVVDWQSIALGCGVMDVSYFLGTSLLTASRLDNEEYLLKFYLDVLSSYKIDLDWNECWHYYRAYAPSGLIMAVIASMIVGETERGNDMFMAMATRSCQQIIELETLELLRK